MCCCSNSETIAQAGIQVDAPASHADHIVRQRDREEPGGPAKLRGTSTFHACIAFGRLSHGVNFLLQIRRVHRDVQFRQVGSSLHASWRGDFFVSIASLMHRERFAPPPPAAPDLPLPHASTPSASAASSLGAAWLLPLAVLAIAILWTIASILPLGAAARFLPFTVLCAVPGVVLARRLYHNATTSWLFALLIGGTWGYAFSSLTLLALWVVGVRRPIWLVLAPIATAFVCSRVRPIAAPLRIPLLGKRDVAAVCLTMLMVPAIVGRPIRASAKCCRTVRRGAPISPRISSGRWRSSPK